jgi:diaminohydroxyphosphoribosylaminopyrimidine deaminase/5-amino-6-(5-phosphoribosylamino)uracil reductase
VDAARELEKEVSPIPFTDFDRLMMARALELAALGRYSTHPNPRVGCVIVQGDRLVGEGWHRKWGEPHAEPLALNAAGAAAKGSTVYVTLEPHSYQSRTPPCTTALINAGVRRVICATLDPNPKVHGNGVRLLREAGIQVDEGLLAAEAHALNAGFEKRMTTGMPRVIVKIAASLDGRVALPDGESRWITGAAARADVHRLRAEASAVLTGIDTVLADDPQLTVRDAQIDLQGRQPLRVVLDSKLRMPSTARMLAEAGETLVFTSGDHRASAAIKATIVTVAKDESGRLDLAAVLRELGSRMCNDVLVEAGPTLAGSMISAGLADEFLVYLAPKLLGADAKAMVLLPALQKLADAPQFRLRECVQVGDDLKLRYVPAIER